MAIREEKPELFAHIFCVEGKKRASWGAVRIVYHQQNGITAVERMRTDGMGQDVWVACDPEKVRWHAVAQLLAYAHFGPADHVEGTAAGTHYYYWAPPDRHEPRSPAGGKSATMAYDSYTAVGDVIGA